jgi:hypothetical protein
LQTLEETKRALNEAVEKTRAADAAAAGSKDDDEAA